MDKAYYVYIVSTDNGNFLFNQDFEELDANIKYHPLITMTFQQETLAPAEDWEDWFLTYDKEMLISMIKDLVKRKIHKISIEIKKGDHDYDDDFR